MIILFFSSLSLAALAGLLALNSAALRAAKARQGRTPSEEKLWEEELARGRAQRRKNNELHGATAVRSYAHKWTHEAETPVPGYVPVWTGNGIGEVIIYVAPDNVDGRAEERRQNAEIARNTAWKATPTGRVVEGTKNAFTCILAAPVILLLLSPFILLLGVPVFLFVGLVGLKLILLIVLLAWCLRDFQNGVADTVVEKMKNK